MAASIEEIIKEAIDLPRHQRLALVRLLLDLDQPGASDEIERNVGRRNSCSHQSSR
jgi:hypothetical protein